MEKLAAALVKAQSELKAAEKDSLNPFYKSHYADLNAVWEACRQALQNNGLAVVQAGAFKDGNLFLVTTLLHISGQSISGEYLVKPTKDDPQGQGSAWTYARRYSLAAICGVTTTESDDDAESATSRAQVPPPQRKAIEQSVEQKKPVQESVSGAVAIVEFKKLKSGTSNKGPWNLYLVKDSEGREFTFLDSILGEKLTKFCAEAKENGLSVNLIGKPASKGNGQELTDIYLEKEEVVEEVPF